MTNILRFFAALLVALPVYAQAPRSYTQPELDQMLAPVALYPDALLSQVLMAATYPVDVIEAARWSRANPGLQGEEAVRAVQNEDWDASVKSLVAFPQLLARMDEQLDWMHSLGEAFLAQEPQVMDTVQQLRQRAQAAGNLQSGEQITVAQQGPAIVIQPAAPQYVYVPYYDPFVVYGPWWWPAYRPVYWAPWPGYARPYHPGVSFSFWWGQPVGLSSNFFYGNFDWNRRYVRVVHPTAYYYWPPVVVNRTVVVDRGRWQHEPRRGAASAERREMQPRQPVQTQNPVQRPQSRAEVNARPPVQVQPAVPSRTAVQAQPAVQARPQIQPQNRDQRQERRLESRNERREARPTTLPPTPAVAPPPARIPPAAQVPAAPGVQVQPQSQVRMPAAVAPQQPRAQGREIPRGEQRNENRAGGGQRS